MFTNTDFEKFLRFSLEQNEVGLLISESKDELIKTGVILMERGFCRSQTIDELMENIGTGFKTFYEIEDNKFKSIYDLTVQYPMGRIQIFDEGTSKSQIAYPQLGKGTVILLATDEQISTMRYKNFAFLNKVGVSYHL